MANPNIYIINRGDSYVIAVGASSIDSNSQDPIDKATIAKIQAAESLALQGNAIYKAIDFPKSLESSGLVKSLSKFLASK